MSIFEQHSDLILSLAKFTSALLIAFAVAPFLKRPALRATFWAGILIILPTMIFATHGRSILNILPQLSAAPEIGNIQPVAPPLEVVTIPALPTDAPTMIPAFVISDVPELPPIVPQAPVRQTNWVAVVFFTGLAISLLPILISVLRIRFIPKKPARGAAMDVWAKIRPQESPMVPLYLTSSPSAPFTAGLIHASVLLPESSTGWSLRRLRSTLYHEAAHISRKDPLVRMFASLVRAIFWFHPLVWLAHRQLVAAQEEACDEIALAAGIPADEYAEDLLETAKYSQGILGHGLSMARWSQLGCRVRLILQNKQNKPKPLTMKNIAIITIGIAATTFGLSSLGFSETPEATIKTAESEIDSKIERLTPDAAALDYERAKHQLRHLRQSYAQAVEKARETDEKLAILELERRESARPKYQAMSPGAAHITERLQGIVIPAVNFKDTTLEEAIDFLRLRAVELDLLKRGFNFVISLPEGAPMPKIPSLLLKEVPLVDVLKYICKLTSMAYSVDEYAVVIEPLSPVASKPIAELDEPGAADIKEKLRRIIIPAIDFEDQPPFSPRSSGPRAAPRPSRQKQIPSSSSVTKHIPPSRKMR